MTPTLTPPPETVAGHFALLQRDYTGPDRGVGAHYAWSGNRKAGTGNMEIVESTVPRVIRVRLEGGLVNGRLSGLQELLEVAGQEVPGEVVILIAVGAIEHDTLDLLAAEDLLQNLDVDEVLLERGALCAVEVVGLVDLLLEVSLGIRGDRPLRRVHRLVRAARRICQV